MIIGLSLLDQVGSFDISDSIVLTDAPESFLSQWTSTVARRAGDEVQLNGVEYVALANLGTGPTVQVSPALEEQNYNDPIRRVAHQAEWGEQRQWARTAVVNNLRLTDGRPGEAATRDQSPYAQFSLPQLITHLALLETVGVDTVEVTVLDGGGEFQLNFSTPNNGGRTIQRYQYRTRLSGSGSWGDPQILPRNRLIGGLDARRTHEFQVRAVNQDGNASWSNTIAIDGQGSINSPQSVAIFFTICQAGNCKAGSVRTTRS